jgi:catechol 2,3-dioxygenase-like lactoylglutathione lyase family enzyme
VRVTGLHHVQLAMPAGGEEQARTFYGAILELPEVEKPPSLAGRGGCWFRNTSVELHLGVEEPFSPARKAHPALVVEDLDALERRLNHAGHRTDGAEPFDRSRRFHTADPFGNRLEFISSA